MKARIAAYKKAIEDATKATAAAELSELIKLNSDDGNDSDDDAHAAFEHINDIKAIGVEEKEDFILD